MFFILFSLSFVYYDYYYLFVQLLQIDSVETPVLINFLEKQKLRYQVAAKEIAELKKSLKELENSDSGSASEAVALLRNEVANVRSKVSFIGIKNTN